MNRLLLILAAVAAPVAAEASCTVTATAVAYGAYDVLSSAPVDSTGSVSYDCLAGTANVMITLDSGNSTTFDRELRSGLNALHHNLYLDAARTRIWGDGTSGTEYYVDPDPPDGQNVEVTIYGRIPARQDVPAGSYTDSITVTINF